MSERKIVWDYMGLHVQSYVDDEGVKQFIVQGEIRLAENDYKNMLTRLLVDAHGGLKE